MAIHGWGTPVSIYEIAVELGIGATGLSLNDSRVRTLLGNPSGAVYMSNAYGKSNNYVGSLVIANSGVNSGVYRPNASSNWSYGSLTPATAYGVALLQFAWTVDRYDNTGDGVLQFASAIGGRFLIDVNGNQWYSGYDNGGGVFVVPQACTQWLENGSGGLTLTLIKA
ncbi:hypothetical protein [Aeromonas hydrophila]|uniref:hypothetical protein n=1 Tax=Aeromonas hydrophila TaxID=644 RepID=UPI002927FE24|nr:hypothetical protein [Aeromonas hydrophila]